MASKDAVPLDQPLIEFLVRVQIVMLGAPVTIALTIVEELTAA
jgi:hypothetical protein